MKWARKTVSITVLLLLTGCCWRHRTTPGDLDPLPPPRSPVYIANAIELRLTATAALGDETRKVNVLTTTDGDWNDKDFRRVWVILRVKLDRNDHISVHPPNAAVGCDYTLQANVDRSDRVPKVKLALTNCKTKAVAWKHTEELILEPLNQPDGAIEPTRQSD